MLRAVNGSDHNVVIARKLLSQFFPGRSHFLHKRDAMESKPLEADHHKAS